MSETRTTRSVEEIETELAKARKAKVEGDLVKAHREAEAAYHKAQDALDVVRKAFNAAQREVANQVADLEKELRDALREAHPQPFGVGDIVADEFGVRYRVTAVAQATSQGYYDSNRKFVEPDPADVVWRAEGIRLTKTGIEAHATPRRLRSPHLAKVETETKS